MTTKHFVMVHRQARSNAKAAIDAADDGYVVTIKPPTRNLEQNAALWALLSEVSKQVEWYGNLLTTEEWKDVFTASLRKEKVVPGISGGFVVLGQRTSKMSKSEFSELLELAHAFAADKGVKINYLDSPIVTAHVDHINTLQKSVYKTAKNRDVLICEN